MEGLRKFFQCEPSDLIEFMWFSVFCFFPIHKNFKIKRDPMGRFSIVYPVHIPESQKLIIDDVRGKFFSDLLF